MSHYREDQARDRKVRALVRAIGKLPEPPKADEVASWALGAQVWTDLAKFATKANLARDGKPVHPPGSNESIRTIVEELREREAIADVADLISSPTPTPTPTPESGERATEGRWG